MRSEKRSARPALTGSVLVGAALALACGKPSAPPRTGGASVGPGDDQSGCQYQGRDDRDVQESVAPGAVVPNVRRVYGYVGRGEGRRRVLLCREVDSNFDGIKDVVRIYGEDGKRQTETADTDFDGVADTWIRFGDSGPVRVELDKTGDGVPDEIRIYSAGELVRIQRDRNGDGKPDVFEVYQDGKLQRMGVDADHDGSVDRWYRDRLASEEGAVAASTPDSEGSSGETSGSESDPSGDTGKGTAAAGAGEAQDAPPSEEVAASQGEDSSEESTEEK